MKAIIYLNKDSRPARRREFLNVARRIGDRYDSPIYGVHTGEELVELSKQFEDETVTHIILICHGWPNQFVLSDVGVHTWKENPAGMVSVARFVRAWARKLTGAPKVSMCACMCGRSPRWYLNKIYGRYVSPWGPVSYRPGGIGSVAARLRDELVMNGFIATVRAHTTAGHTTRNPIIREFLPLLGDPGVSMFEAMWGMEPTLKNRRKWVREIKGQTAEDLILFEV